MQSDLLLLKRMLLTIVTFTGIALTSQGQIPLTIDKAMEIAQENSPSLRRSYAFVIYPVHPFSCL